MAAISPGGGIIAVTIEQFIHLTKPKILSKKARPPLWVFNPALSPWRIDNFKPKMLEFRSYLKKYGCLRSAKLGKADMDIVDAAGFLDMLRDLTKHSVTIYHRPAIGLIRKICKFPY